MSTNMPADFELRDSITGIFSRATFDLQFEQTILRANRYGESFTLLFLDNLVQSILAGTEQPNSLNTPNTLV